MFSGATGPDGTLEVDVGAEEGIEDSGASVDAVEDVLVLHAASEAMDTNERNKTLFNFIGRFLL